MPAGYAEEATNHSVSLMNGVIYFFFLGFKTHLFYLGHRIEAYTHTHTHTPGQMCIYKVVLQKNFVCKDLLLIVMEGCFLKLVNSHEPQTNPLVAVHTLSSEDNKTKYV